MRARTAATLAEATDGALHGADRPFTAMVSDSRQMVPGACFAALSGERFDGHDYVAQAAAGGAAVALVARQLPLSLPQVVVEDVLAALQAFAAFWRRQFTLPVVGITGANGKTTLRALCEAVLAPLAPVLATRGNLNNHIGVPLTLCRLAPEHRIAVIEMGANHLGELTELAAMAQPSVGAVTNSGEAHLEGFGSREAAARGEGAELLEALPEDGVAIFNADDACAALFARAAGARRQLRFGITASAEIRASQIVPEPAAAPRAMRFVLHAGQASTPVRLPLPGVHNVANALAAAAVGLAQGLDLDTVAAGLAQARPPAGRLVWQTLPDGGALLDDSYNANPDSLAAGVALLAASTGHRVLVLGDMAELGAGAAALHRRAGEAARAAGIDGLYALGALAAEAARAFGPEGRAFDSVEALCEALREDMQHRHAGDWVLLVKGSRSARMERVVAALNSDSQGGQDALPPL